MKPIRLINLGAAPAWQTQAIYHALAESMDSESQDTIVICRPKEPYLCIGYHQVFESIFNPAECAQRGLAVYRRRLGGGATYLDGNQIFYQYIFHHTHMPVMLKDIYSFTLAGPVQTLRKLGLHAELRETNEIEVDGKRISGIGGGRMGDATVVVGNILFDFNHEAMTAVWRTPSPSFQQLAQRALHQQIVTMKDLAPHLSMEYVTNLLISAVSESMGRELEPGGLTSEEWHAAEEESRQLTSAEQLALHKIDSTVTPVHTLKISARAFICHDEVKMDDYHIRGSFWLSEGIIQAAMLESQPDREWHSMEQTLNGTPFKDWKDHLLNQNFIPADIALNMHAGYDHQTRAD
jgi:lipoate-protein ligase A